MEIGGSQWDEVLLKQDGVGNMCQTDSKTNSCEAPNTVYVISGRIKVVTDDGSEIEGGPGDAAIIPAGYNGWVVGDEPCVMLDFTGAKDYTKSA